MIFLLLAALAATLASLVVYSALKRKDQEVQKALAGTTPIVVAAHDITIGTKIDAGAVKMMRWPRDSLPPAAMTDASSAVGSVARAEFVENEPIVASRLVAANQTSGVLPLMLPNDMRAMSVAVDEVSDMAGFVLPYTRVDVLLSLTGSDKDVGRSKIVLENIPVLAVAQTVERKDNPQPERVVTLEVTPDQAEALAVASTQGKLHLALRSYGDNSVVATSGSDVHKVMSAYSTELPEPIPTRQSMPAPAAVRRVYRRPRRPPMPRVELLRDGRSRESIVIARDGRAISASTGGPASDGTPSAYTASLGDQDNNEAGGYGNQTSSDSGMPTMGASSGGDSK